MYNIKNTLRALILRSVQCLVDIIEFDDEF